MSAIGYELAKAYEKGELNGWEGGRNPQLVKSAFNLLAGEFKTFRIAGQTRATTGRKTFLSDCVRAVLGKDVSIGPQETGDCVSWGAKHATEILTCTQIVGLAAKQGDIKAMKDFIATARAKWRPVFAPYYYGTGRVYEGRGQLRGQAGSLGSWMFAAAKKYGTLFEDLAGVPKYSGQIANLWGDDKATLDKWRDKAGDYVIKAGGQITSWDDLCGAVHNGYPVTTASSYGYSMEPGRDGFHIQNTRWDHQMLFFGVDETWDEPYALVYNQWGDVHGHLKDFQTGEPLPEGILRIRRADAEKHLNRGECFVYSGFEAYPEQELDKALFMLI